MQIYVAGKTFSD